MSALRQKSRSILSPDLSMTKEEVALLRGKKASSISCIVDMELLRALRIRSKDLVSKIADIGLNTGSAVSPRLKNSLEKLERIALDLIRALDGIPMNP